jgi:hypothetical protein
MPLITVQPVELRRAQLEVSMMIRWADVEVHFGRSDYLWRFWNPFFVCIKIYPSKSLGNRRLTAFCLSCSRLLRRETGERLLYCISFPAESLSTGYVAFDWQNWIDTTGVWQCRYNVRSLKFRVILLLIITKSSGHLKSGAPRQGQRSRGGHRPSPS